MAELELAQRFNQVARTPDGKLSISEGLHSKALEIIAEIERRYQAQGTITHEDAEAIYDWRYNKNGDHWYGLVPNNKIKIFLERNIKTITMRNNSKNQERLAS